MPREPLPILLIDDDEDSYVVTRYLLTGVQDWSVDLDWESTYDAGLAAIMRQEHAIYLIDHRLDTASGLELLREAVAHGCRKPMVMLTGIQDRKVDVQAMQAGAADYLLKDRLDAPTLDRCIRYTLERQRLRDALEDRAARLHALAGQLSQAEQRERARVARLLHDHLQQVVVSTKMHVEGMGVDRLTEQRGRVQELLDQVMDISRTLAVELNPPILLDAGLAAALKWLAVRMDEKHGLHVDADVDANAEPRSETVRMMLFHAVRELLFNVTKHAGVREAKLQMRRVDDDRVQIVVADEGAGFDVRKLAHKPDDTTGFGLLYLRDRLGLIGGQLDVESAPGAGCRISLVAPRRGLKPGPKAVSHTNGQHLAPVTHAAPEAADHPDDQRIRVLIADDHPLVREGLARTLAAQPDIEVVGEANDGEQAIELTERLEPDVVLMDVIMPRVDGVEATRRIVQQFGHVRVIGLSMYSDADMAQVMQDVGAEAFVSKGSPAEALLACIRQGPEAVAAAADSSPE
ncbi:MAG: response regulator [Phycisphaeraceae bacterium]